LPRAPAAAAHLPQLRLQQLALLVQLLRGPGGAAGQLLRRPGQQGRQLRGGPEAGGHWGGRRCQRLL
jgi:hypothetical protein